MNDDDDNDADYDDDDDDDDDTSAVTFFLEELKSPVCGFDATTNL